MRVLIIDDEARTLAFIARGFREEGHTVDQAGDGTRGFELGLTGDYDAMVVDRMLPGMSGIELIQALRKEGVATPILMLSAVGAVDDRVEGLQAGADDYLLKPFAFSELSARVQALGRRPPLAAQPRSYVVGDLEVDVAAHRAVRAGKAIDLSPHEFKLLTFLAQHAGQVVTRTMLLETLWGFHFDPRANIIDAHVSRLRAKVDRGFGAEMIHTLRGVGYVLQAPQ
ncbi:response regulator transcription factor [Phenylobacterium sp.]|jgi:two-component system OmpR family response regulator|uniref:response regulator transcription factor n=1 Tax=Phenylobacterium sp. TaxID=1871053 RepID=UPI003782D534